VSGSAEPLSGVVHNTARVGFGRDPSAYVRGRPDYPGAMQLWLGDELQLQTGRTAVDLGAGTGKFTRLLLATGARVLAIEPVAAMAAELARSLPAVQIQVGSAEALPLTDGCADVVVCAQSFHWFASSAALQEIRRVLRPGGRLGLVWNNRDESLEWVAAMTRIMTPHQGDAPRQVSGEWRRQFPADGFGPLQHTRFAHSHTGPPQQVIIDRVLSTSFIAQLPPGEQQHVIAQLQELIAGTPALAGRSEVSVPYATDAWWCCRL
jgi:SAM-dependent methyltransferase